MSTDVKSYKTDNPWTTLATEERYSNPWIQVSHHDVLNPAGCAGIYGVVHFKNTAIGIVPLDHEMNTWLVGQYRYPLKRYSWEIPAGGGPLDTDPVLSAKRELLEETGIEAAHWTPILNSHLSNSVSDEYSCTYVAQGLTFGNSQPEATEQLVVKKIPFDDVLAMVLNGDITDSLTMLSVMKVKLMLDQGVLSRQ